MKKIILKTLIMVAVVGFILVSATNQTMAEGRDFTLKIIPGNYTPNSSISAKLNSFQFDANRASITWVIDGETILTGVGERTVKLRSPEFGENKKITVSIVTSDGKKTTKSLLLTGNNIDFLWEAETSTPAGYKGKALATIGSRIKITAVPYLFKNGRALASEDLIYDWWLNFDKEISASGANKQSFSFELKNTREYNLLLKVSDRASSVSFEKNFIISANQAQPEVVFYEDHPLEGPRYEKALTGTTEIDSDSGEILVRAEPFYFSKDNLGGISYKWEMNGNALTTDEKPNVLRLRTPENGSGEAIIKVVVKHPRNFMQYAQSAIKFIFGLRAGFGR